MPARLWRKLFRQEVALPWLVLGAGGVLSVDLVCGDLRWCGHIGS
jgi:hypothetical protein